MQEMLRPFLLFVAVVAACGHIESGPPKPSAMRSISVLIETVDADNKSQPSTLASSDVRIEFPLITGSLVGLANTGTILFEQAQVGQTVRLDVERLRAGAVRLAAPLDRRMLEAGVLVEPRNARLARIATFAYGSKSNIEVGSVGFVEPQTRVNLVLVYFDEPCRVSGLFRMEGMAVKHDIVISSPGLHWIRARKTEDGHFHLENGGEYASVVLAIQPLRQPPRRQGA